MKGGNSTRFIRIGTMTVLSCLLILVCLAIQVQSAAAANAVRGQQKSPLRQDQIEELISLLPDAAVAAEIRDRGVIFAVTYSTLTHLRSLGAKKQTLRTLEGFENNNYPSV